MGLSYSSVDRWFKGSVPRSRAITEAADLLGVSPDWLATGDGEMLERSEILDAASTPANHYAASIMEEPPNLPFLHPINPDLKDVGSVIAKLKTENLELLIRRAIEEGLINSRNVDLLNALFDEVRLRRENQEPHEITE